MSRVGTPSSVTDLIEYAEQCYGFLMSHPTNREDAMQVVRMVAETAGDCSVELALARELSKLASDLGYHKIDGRWELMSDRIRDTARLLSFPSRGERPLPAA